MFRKLQNLKIELESIDEKLIDPAIASNQKEYVSLWKRASELRPIIDLYNEYLKYEKQKEEAIELLKDNEMKELAEQELELSKQKLIDIEEKLKIVLLPKDPNDDRDIIVEIRSAAWWDEAWIFAWELMRMYVRYADTHWFTVEIMTTQDIEPNWLKYWAFKVIWKWAYSRFKYESWVHRVQRVPETESQWRVHTSTATVAVMPEVDDLPDVIIRPDEIRIDTFRAQWAWWQHVNKTDSAIRITHIASWLAVECQDSRSQHKNKASALSVLKSRLYSVEMDKRQKDSKDMRLAQVWTWDRSEKIRTYNFPQDRLTDHRIKANWSNLPLIMLWNLDDIFDKIAIEDQAMKLMWENFNN